MNNPRQLSFGKFASEADTFQSHQGNTIQLGHRNRIAPSNSYQNYDFLRHYDGPNPVSHNQLLNSSPKEHRQARRPVTSIENPRSKDSQLYQQQKEANRASFQSSRSLKLLQYDKQTGYNIITGQIIGKGPKESRAHVKYLPNGLGPESHHRGLQIMKDSESRYFAPLPTGESNTTRQKILLSEGLSHPKQSKVLAPGCRESLPSYGMEDQFSKNQYNPNGPSGLQGLVEERQPGKYSPRKQGPSNPSGNLQVRNAF